MIASVRHLLPIPNPNPTPSHHRRPAAIVICSSRVEAETRKAEPLPVFSTVRSFAPATVANLGPGFDFLGCAVSGIGDHVTVVVDPSVRPGRVAITAVHGAPKLTLDPMNNCAGIAAIAVLRALGVRSVGVSLTLEKGLPLGSGLGSSAASAAAAASAVNALFGDLLSGNDLVLAGLESEAKVSGRHADNIAPSILGGFVLVRSCDPLELIRLPFPAGRELLFVLVSPEFEAPTKKMRAVLPEEIAFKDHIWNSRHAAAVVAALAAGDVAALGAAMSADRIVEPRRSPLIPGMVAVKEAAVAAGAFGCTISGAGPTAVAVTDDEAKGQAIGEAMAEAFLKVGGLRSKVSVQRLDHEGARVNVNFMLKSPTAKAKAFRWYLLAVELISGMISNHQ
ncbi:Homoserine kinase [Nymphaea thermarum]|nr:Homoserine kinase [Nymphaea thermarum]